MALLTVALLSGSSGFEFLRLGKSWLGFIERIIFFRYVRQVRATEIIAHGGPGAGRVHVGSSAARGNVVKVNGAEVDTETRAAGIVGHARMHLRTRKQEHATGRGNHADETPWRFPRQSEKWASTN